MKASPVIVNTARLRNARGGRTLREVAQLLGITAQQLWNIENGKRGPSLGVLVRLCALYNLPLEKMIVKNQRAA